MAAPENIDELLMCIMSMGFDYNDCQDAVKAGKISVESAVEWLLAGKPSSPSQGPSLRLRGTSSGFEEGINPFSNPEQSKPLDVPADDESSQPQTASEHESLSADERVISRLHLNDDQRKSKHRFEQKQIEEARKEAIIEKQRRKRDHARILKEIQEDRDVKKNLSVPNAEVKTKDENASSSKPSQVSSPVRMCSLQIRLPDGSSIRHTFEPSSSLRNVWDYVVEHKKDPLKNCVMIQPFPHKEFSEEEYQQNLQSLGLCPSGSIVIKHKETDQAIASAVPTTGHAADSATGFRSRLAQPDCRGASEDRVLSGAPPIVPGMPVLGNPGMHLPVAQNARSSWGQGHKLGDSHDSSERGENSEPMDVGRAEGGQADLQLGAGNEMEEEEAEEEEEENVYGDGMEAGGPFADMMGQGGLGGPPGFAGGGMGLPVAFGRGRGAVGGYLGFPGGLGGFDGQGPFQGVGQRLIPEGHPRAEEAVHHNRPARELAAEKARERYAKPPAPEKQEMTMQSQKLHQVPCLRLVSLKHIANRLLDPRGNLHSLSGISEDLAQTILEYLRKEKLLSPKLLNAFIPCYLQKLVLDCYPYATNDLLNSVRLHPHITHLSLKSCTLITDAGLIPLVALKKLKYLNLSGCKITNRAFQVIVSFDKLRTLLLEDTGISEEGVIEYLQSCSKCLSHLNLNKTNVTEKIIHHLQALPELKTLFLEGTRVCGLSGIEALRELESLDVSGTDIVTESVICLRENSSLTSLGLANTRRVNGDQALKNISGLNLHALKLPERHSVTNTGMQFISGFPLQSLDLTNYTNVGDAGMEEISKIISLENLLLSNTNLTDAGMVFLANLKKLTVLYLDKTAITDEGALMLKEFTHLQELSLTNTSVTSKFLLAGTLNNSRFLTKLNLSRTLVSTKGILCLSLPHLTLLNLDGTRVKMKVLNSLYTTCPNLKKATLTNLVPYNSDEEES